MSWAEIVLPRKNGATFQNGEFAVVCAVADRTLVRLIARVTIHYNSEEREREVGDILWTPTSRYWKFGQTGLAFPERATSARVTVRLLGYRRGEDPLLVLERWFTVLPRKRERFTGLGFDYPTGCSQGSPCQITADEAQYGYDPSGPCGNYDAQTVTLGNLSVTPMNVGGNWYAHFDDLATLLGPATNYTLTVTDTNGGTVSTYVRTP